MKAADGRIEVLGRIMAFMVRMGGRAYSVLRIDYILLVHLAVHISIGREDNGYVLLRASALAVSSPRLVRSPLTLRLHIAYRFPCCVLLGFLGPPLMVAEASLPL